MASRASHGGRPRFVTITRLYCSRPSNAAASWPATPKLPTCCDKGGHRLVRRLGSNELGEFRESARQILGATAKAFPKLVVGILNRVRHGLEGRGHHHAQLADAVGRANEMPIRLLRTRKREIGKHP